MVSICPTRFKTLHSTHRVYLLVRLQVLTEANMKMAVFWDVAPCSLVEIDWHFRGAYCLHNQGDAYSEGTSETSVNFNEATPRNIPEDYHYLYLLVSYDYQNKQQLLL
jgi:hypothetical protein